MFRTTLRRLPARVSPSSRTTTASAAAAARQQTRQAHAISNPTLANIEKRWDAMPPQEQADLWMALRDRMKVDWTEMTLQEKKAGMSPPSLPSAGRVVCLVEAVKRSARIQWRIGHCLAQPATALPSLPTHEY